MNIIFSQNQNAIPEQILNLVNAYQQDISQVDCPSYQILVTKNHICLVSTVQNKIHPVLVDFTNATLIYRLKHGGGLKEVIAKAVGIKGKARPVILDATAGLGRDAFILSSLGCQVTMLERSPVFSLLLTDGLRRLAESDSEFVGISKRMKHIYTDSQDYLSKTSDNFDVIYLDPMFPSKNKNALVKKEMRIAKEVVGSDFDSDKLLEEAMKNDISRVVVKRMLHAEHLGHKKPDTIIKTPKNRYDLYIKQP